MQTTFKNHSELRIAARNGNPDAIYQMGIYYKEHGNLRSAFDHFKRAAKNNVALANIEAGKIMLTPFGGNNRIVAEEWFHDAEATNDPETIFTLGQAFFNGDGVSIDIARANRYFENAHSLGYEGADKYLAIISSNKAEYDKAMAGDADTQYKIAKRYLSKDDEASKAIGYNWLDLAANSGSKIAAYEYGLKYQDVPPYEIEASKARHYMEMAGDYSDAKQRVEKLDNIVRLSNGILYDGKIYYQENGKYYELAFDNLLEISCNVEKNFIYVKKKNNKMMKISVSGFYNSKDKDKVQKFVDIVCKSYNLSFLRIGSMDDSETTVEETIVGNLFSRIFMAIIAFFLGGNVVGAFTHSYSDENKIEVKIYGKK